MDEIKVRYTGGLQRLNLKPGEVLALTVDAVIDAMTAERIKAAILTAFPDGTKALVLAKGMRLSAVNASAADAIEKLRESIAEPDVPSVARDAMRSALEQLEHNAKPRS